MPSDFHLDRLPIIVETSFGRAYGGGCGCGNNYGCGCGCDGSCGCGCGGGSRETWIANAYGPAIFTAPPIRRGHREVTDDYAGAYGARLLGVGWPDWWYSKEAYATCPEYTKIVDQWIKIRDKGVRKFGSIGWFAPDEAKQMVRRLQALEEKGDSIVRACKAGAGGSGEYAPPEEKQEVGLPVETADNTMLYVGLGALTLVGLGLGAVAVIRKKKKKAD